jgi:Na+/melibiose symporter-like transporter
VIITCKKQVPWRWITFAILPWAAFTFYGQVMGWAFMFSLKKFIENPAGVTFVLSLPGFIAMIGQPIVSFLSDRIWTRFGRRKPFILTGMVGIAVCLVLLPLMPNFWSLLVVFLLYNIFTDLNAPLEPLKQEIIPPAERGRATGAMSWCSNLATLTFFFIALGRFDDVRYMAGVPLYGEAVIYWSAALLLGVMVLLIMLGIKEIDPKSSLRGQRFTIRNFLAGLFDHELWPVYLLVVGAACLNYYAGLGPLGNLLYTDQWGYTKQEMGINVAVGGVINLFAIGLLTVFADRFNRMRAYQMFLCLSLVANVAYYGYVNFVLPDKHPSLVEIIVFGETYSIIGILTGLVYVPLVYDYVRRNRMGTYNAGATLINRLTTVLTLNGVGLFVWGHATLFQPPAGEMTRVVLRGVNNHKTEVRRALPADLDVNAWQATGAIADRGRCWEIRHRNKDSQTIADEKDKLEKQNSPLISEEKMLRDKVTILQRQGKSEAATQAEREANGMKVQIQQNSARSETLNTQLADRAEKFRAQVVQVLGDRLIADGEQVTGATLRQASLIELATAQRPDAHVLEKMLDDLRRDRPDIIDLRPLKLDGGYGVVVSALEPVGNDLQTAVERVAAKRAPGLFTPGKTPLAHTSLPALTLDLMVVEEPLDTYVSPITRVVNAVLALFDRVPRPDRRLTATARNLRVPAEINHVRASAGNSPKTISITAVLPASAPKAASVDDPVGRQLRALLGDGDTLAQARAFYDRIEKAAATQRLTVARPILATAYAPMKYDYMSGYLLMFLMSVIGIAITVMFRRFEAKGLIRKRGVEEAEAS